MLLRFKCYSDERLFQGVSCSFPTAVSTGERPESKPLGKRGKRRSLQTGKSQSKRIFPSGFVRLKHHLVPQRRKQLTCSCLVKRTLLPLLTSGGLTGTSSVFLFLPLWSLLRRLTGVFSNRTRTIQYMFCRFVAVIC